MLRQCFTLHSDHGQIKTQVDPSPMHTHGHTHTHTLIHTHTHAHQEHIQASILHGRNVAFYFFLL
jgi:hypothetical protein